MSKWFKINACSSCLQRILNEDYYNNDGVCPHCGNDSGSTICDVKPVILIKIVKVKWWVKFWEREVTYIGKDDFSNEYIKRNKLNK